MLETLIIFCILSSIVISAFSSTACSEIEKLNNQVNELVEDCLFYIEELEDEELEELEDEEE